MVSPWSQADGVFAAQKNPGQVTARVTTLAQIIWNG